MTDKRNTRHGGVTIKVGDNATVGNIAGRDQNITTTTTTTTTQVVDVEALGAHLAELYALVQELRRAVDGAPDVKDERRRNEVVHALSGAGMELAAAGDEVRALPPGEPVPAALSGRINDQLATLAATGKSAASLVTSVQTLALKLGPLISAAGSLFG